MRPRWKQDGLPFLNITTTTFYAISSVEILHKLKGGDILSLQLLFSKNSFLLSIQNNKVYGNQNNQSNSFIPSPFVIFKDQRCKIIFVNVESFLYKLFTEILLNIPFLALIILAIQQKMQNVKIVMCRMFQAPLGP